VPPRATWPPAWIAAASATTAIDTENPRCDLLAAAAEPGAIAATVGEPTPEQHAEDESWDWFKQIRHRKVRADAAAIWQTLKMNSRLQFAF
jgi:hypothetical protein